MNKKFVREVLRLLPDFRVTDGHYFFELPTQHVLAGFLWEKPPSGVRVWKYAFPLYEGGDYLHLGYGDRLPRPDDLIHIRTGEDLIHPVPGQEQSVAEEFVRRIAPYRQEVSKLRDLDSLLNYQRSISLANPLRRRGLALTLIMVGDADKASEQLALCLKASNDPELKKSVFYWLTAIQDGTAKQKLTANEEQLRRQFDIPPS